MRRKVLIVDDKPNTLKVLRTILEDEDFTVVTAQNGTEALSVCEQQDDVDAVLADLKMPGIDGLELFHRLRIMKADLPFIIMTAHGTVASAVKAMQEGVANYLIKPLNYDELSLVLNRAIKEKKMSDELADLRREVRRRDSYQNIIGTHSAMKRVFEMLDMVAPTDEPVLIYGETGTGKELLARAIHAASNRHTRPLVCINSAAVTENLLEAELFGYKKGAFTGAIANKKGRLEMADRGTLFLDEIGYMSLNLQKKLLRFLQEGSFEPVGDVNTRYVDVRVIAATNRRLDEEIQAKRFLSDLYYRIDVFTITLPPLRERGDDLLLLIDHFIKRYTDKYQKVVDAIDDPALEALAAYPWPGNIRELENCIARCVILAKDRTIGVDQLPQKVRDSAESAEAVIHHGHLRNLPPTGITLKSMEKELIAKTLELCGGNKSRSAEMLGLSRKALYEKLRRFRIR